MKKIAASAVLSFLLLTGAVNLFSQTSDFSLRSSVNVELKLAKKLKLEVTPEYRFSPATGTSSLLAEAGLNYRFASWLTLGGYYRFEGSGVSAAESSDGQMFETSNRFALDVSSKVDLGRFTPKARIRYSNFTDFDSQTDDRTAYMRYRLGLGYNIPGIKLTPSVSVEFYEKMSTGLFSKARYSVGAEYAFNKHHSLSLDYSYADKFSNLTRYHIFELGYSFKF